MSANQFPFARNRKDALYVTSKANAATGANSNSFDLEQATAGDLETIAVELALPAEALLSDAKVLTFKLEDSADGVTFAAVDPAISTTQTGAGGAGVAAKKVRFRLPVNTRRFIRIAQTVTATPGTLSGSFTVSLLF